MYRHCTAIKPWLRWLRSNWRYIFIFLVPILLAPIPAIGQRQEAKCGYVILVMAAYWMTEAVPISVTSLIPVFAFPLLGILSTGDCCLAYMKQTNMMFLGGLMVAISIEYCNLHKRIALFVILNVGQSPRRLMAGFMLTTTFLSMWISNTASTAMMVPIVTAILKELYPEKKEQETVGDKSWTIGGTERVEIPSRMELQEMEEKGVQNGGFVSETDENYASQSEVEIKTETKETEDDDGDSGMHEKDLMGRALLLAVAYSANIGGTGVVTGTAPNLVLMSQLAESFSEPTGLNFTTWMAYSVPGLLICAIISWIWLQVLFLGLFRKNSTIKPSTPEREATVRRLINEKYRELGPMTQHEKTVLLLFVALVALWVFRKPEFIPGWTSIFSHDLKIGSATPAMFIVFMLFALPSKFQVPWSKDFKDGAPKMERPKACLSWEVVVEKVPWGIVILLGGGFAMADAAKASGLSLWLGAQFEGLQVLPKEAIVLILSLMITMITEVASNTATSLVFLPVLRAMAININVNPLYLMLPATICCSYAFMLPVATAPNAIVFSACKMKTTDMMKAGFVMNIICVTVAIVMINTLGVAMFDLHNIPEWVHSTIE